MYWKESVPDIIILIFFYIEMVLYVTRSLKRFLHSNFLIKLEIFKNQSQPYLHGKQLGIYDVSPSLCFSSASKATS